QRDFDGLAACFAPDATSVHHGGAQHFVGGAALAEALATTLATYRSTTHALANLTLNHHEGVVRARYMATVWLVPQWGETVVVRGVSYDDDIVRLDDRSWVIARRLHAQVWQYTVKRDRLTPQ